MRAGVGLLALLIGVCLIFYLMFGGPGKSSYVRTELEARQKADTEIEQISGKTADGKLATDSFTFDTTPKGVAVKTVDPGGAFDQHFGLKPGDVIIEIGPLEKDQFQDNETAKAYLHDAYARNEPLVVLRGDQRVTLPLPPEPGAPPAPVRRMNPSLQAHNLLDKIRSH